MFYVTIKNYLVNINKKKSFNLTFKNKKLQLKTNNAKAFLLLLHREKTAIAKRKPFNQIASY